MEWKSERINSLSCWREIYQRYKKKIWLSSRGSIFCHGKAFFRSFRRCLKSVFWSVRNWVNASRFKWEFHKEFRIKTRLQNAFYVLVVFSIPFNCFFMHSKEEKTNWRQQFLFVSMRLTRLHSPAMTLSKSTIWLWCPDRQH